MTKNAARRKRKNALINSVVGKGTPKTTTEVRAGRSHKVAGVVVKTRAKESAKVDLKIAAPTNNNVGTITPVHPEKTALIPVHPERTVLIPVHPERTVLILNHPRGTIRGHARITRITGVEVEETTTTIPEATIQADAPIHVHLSHLVAHKTSKVVVTKATITPIPPAITMVVEIQRVEAKGTTTTGEIKIGINAAGRGNPTWLPLHQGAPPISMEHGNAK